MFDLGSDMQGCSMEELSEKVLSPVETMTKQMNTTQNYWAGFAKYLNEFMIPYLLASSYWNNVEQSRVLTTSPLETFKSYMELMEFNTDISNRYFLGSLRALNDYGNKEMQNLISAWFNTVFNLEGEDIETFIERQSKIMDLVVNAYPQAIRDVESEYGFHFERGVNPKFAETDRFIVYKIMPTEPGVDIDDGAKPILIMPPYVLGANILAFLPNDKKSYTHAFANFGIPTYIRIMKNIHQTPAVQTMTAEDDALDTKYFCEKIKEAHQKPVTLNGYCQGGFSAVCDILSGELDGLVDALLTCVSPMDGTRSLGLRDFLMSLPQRFNDLQYGTKTLPNGNKVADGTLMGWVYKLKSIEVEAPVVALIRDMMMLSPRDMNKEVKIPKTAAAINYWLGYERTDLPLAITRMSFDSYNIPVAKDGTLPVTLFDRKLNFKRIAEKGVKWLICYGLKDDLVEPNTALAPQDFIDVETSGFPKGHVAIATSWSNPRSECALHTRFGENKSRGPVRFQLDLDEALNSSEPRKKKPAAKSKAKKAEPSKTADSARA